MKCVICRKSETKSGVATVTLERNHMTIVIKHVPALICPNCGEEYVNEGTTDQLLKIADNAFSSGVQVDIRNYITA